MVLTADRLSLRRLTSTEVRTVLAGGRLPGPGWAPGYPLDSTLVSLAIQAGRDDDEQLFGHFQVLHIARNEVIGDISFHGPPDPLGEATISYAIVPAERGNGYATEAVRALVAWALERPEIRVIRAESDVGNHASHHVLEMVGMRHTFDSEDRRMYEIEAG